jgi:hypothetical protein
MQPILLLGAAAVNPTWTDFPPLTPSSSLPVKMSQLTADELVRHYNESP